MTTPITDIHEAKAVRAADSLQSLTNSLANAREVMATNRFVSRRMDRASLRALWKLGLPQKIVRLKAGYALNDTLEFDNEDDAELFRGKLERAVKKAARFMVGFGRGLIVLAEPGEDLAKPRTRNNVHKGAVLQVFSGDMVSAVARVETDLMSPRYGLPVTYHVRSYTFHHSRCIDFVYHRPVEEEAGIYDYGGVSEFELIAPQLMADEIVQRAAPALLEKSAQKIYKVKGFYEALASGQQQHVVEMFTRLEDMASVYGASIIDAEDAVEGLSQGLQNMGEIDTFSLRRLACVTGIPLALLVGENVRGLNSTGDQERAAFQDMVETLQFDFLLEPIQDICRLFGVDHVEFKENQGGTALDRHKVDAAVLSNAQAMALLGEDYRPLLQENGLVPVDEPALFDYPEPDAESMAPIGAAAPSAPGAEAASVAEGMDAPQLASLLEIVERVALGRLPRGSALAIIRLAFPSVTEAQAEAALGEVGRGFVIAPASEV